MITVGQLRRAKWSLAFEYDETGKPPMHFRIYTNLVAPKLTMAHVIRPDVKTDVQYRSHGTKCGSLADAVKRYNEHEARTNGRGQAAGSVESLRAIKGEVF